MLDIDHLGRENAENKDINVQAMRTFLYLFVLLCKLTARKGRPWTLSTSRPFVWLHKTSIFTGEFFLQLSKCSYQFLSINFFLCWIINRLPKMQKGRKKSRVVADYGEGNKSPQQSEESIIFNQCWWENIASGQPDRPQKSGREWRVYDMCVFHLNYALLGQANIQSIQRK